MKKYILVPYEESMKEESHRPNTHAAQQESIVHSSTSLSNAQVLSNIPRHLKAGASRLLNQLLQSKLLSWNDKGEIIIEDRKAIEGSDISSLLKFSQLPFDNFKPTGYLQFANLLSSLGLHTRGRSKKSQIGHGIPPGLPNSKYKIRTLGQKSTKPAWRWKTL